MLRRLKYFFYDLFAKIKNSVSLDPYIEILSDYDKLVQRDIKDFRDDPKSLDKLLKEYLAEGFDLNQYSPKDNIDYLKTPLTEAIYMGHLKAAKVLIDNGATFEVSCPDLENKKTGHMLHLFIDEFNCPNFNKNDIIEKINFCLENGMDVNSEKLGITPLMKSTSITISEILLSYGANIKLKDSMGRTVLHHAVEKSNKVEYLEFLLNNGADVNSVDIRGETPLFVAELNNKLEFVKFLKKHKAMVTRDLDGKTPNELVKSETVRFKNSLDNRLSKFIKENKSGSYISLMEYSPSSDSSGGLQSYSIEYD